MNDSSNQRLLNQTRQELVVALNEQMAPLARLARPYVIVDLVPRHSVNLLYFRIRNVGHVPAYQIRLVVDPPISIRDRVVSELNLFQRGIGVLAPHDELSFFFDSAIELFNNPDAVLQFSIRIDYVGPDDEEYADEFPIDAELLRNLAVELPPSDKIVEQLKRIQRELERLARYADELRMQDLRQRLEEMRREEASQEDGTQS